MKSRALWPLLWGVIALSWGLGSSPAQAAGPEQFLEFIRQQASDLRAGQQPPATETEWAQRATALKANLLKAWGGFPTGDEVCPLEPKKLGEVQGDGYRVEKIVFQTRPNVWATTNAYVPNKPGKLPTVLCVHGHWAGAKQDPVVQSRCIGLAKLGFFVLAIDAFGAGERGITKNLGQYHGEMTGATLLPIGLPLSGLQVYENQRAVDYLLTRPEVDPERLGITGASGGGNQSMYAGTFDDRFRAVVPVCSVGNYQAYLGAACCMCEVVPGALRFTEEGELLGLAAKRSLMVISATRDARQFSVPEAAKSIQFATPIFALQGRASYLRHTIIESPHHYNEPMRSAMYGWMTKQLKGEGTGDPLPEPTIKTEEPEALRCYPGTSRPEDFVTIPQFAGAEARRLLANRTLPTDVKGVQQWQAEKRQALKKGLGSLPESTAKPKSTEQKGDLQVISFDSEPGIELNVYLSGLPTTAVAPSIPRIAVLLDLDQPAEATATGELAKALRAAGYLVAAPELRATGRLAVAGDKIGAAPDHNTAEWSLWVGRPLIGQWTTDARRALDVVESQLNAKFEPAVVAAIGSGSAGLVALSAGACDERFSHVAAINSLASFVTDEPYKGQRLGTLIPGVLRDVGDVSDIAALVAPRSLVIAGGVSSVGALMPADALNATYQRTRTIAERASGKFVVQPTFNAAEFVSLWK